MTGPRAVVRRVLHAPGVRRARKAAELAVTPEARIELDRLRQSHLQLNHLVVHEVEQRARLIVENEQLRAAVADIESHLPAVLNAISSMNGASRYMKRELDSLRNEFVEMRDRTAARVEELGTSVSQGDLDVLGQVRPHVETLTWLMQRVETVRFEMLNELRYGSREGGPSTTIEPRVLNADALERSPLRVNIGAGHIPFDDFVNVDMRELPGIDVVATVDDLPFEPGTLDEIYSSHTLEHFPQELLRRQLLPYWTSLLKPGGTLTTVAPDLAAMSNDYANGDTPFEDYREVLYGGQEYEGDTHFTGFTPDSFRALLEEAGYSDFLTVASGRRNGKCKEFEISARKAS